MLALQGGGPRHKEQGGHGLLCHTREGSGRAEERKHQLSHCPDDKQRVKQQQLRRGQGRAWEGVRGGAGAVIRTLLWNMFYIKLWGAVKSVRAYKAECNGERSF